MKMFRWVGKDFDFRSQVFCGLLLLSTLPAAAASPTGSASDGSDPGVREQHEPRDSVGVVAKNTAAPEDALSEIIVTAGKSGDQRLLDAPYAIQAVSGETVQKTGANSFLDIASRFPGLTINSEGPGDSRYIIRGIYAVGEGTTGVYYDETVITGGNAFYGNGLQADIKPYDLDRIEVLRGPQGTLYGSSSMSGTVRLITNKPALDATQGYVNATESYTTHGSQNYNYNAMLNLPVLDGILGVRVVGWIGNDSGYVDALRVGAGADRGAASPIGTREDGLNNDDVKGGRAMLRYRPSDRFTLDLSVTDQNESSDNTGQFTPTGITGYSTNSVPSSPVNIAPMQGCDLCNLNVTLLPYQENLHVYNATADYELDTGSLIATVSEFDRFTQYDNDSTPILIDFGVPAAAVSENIEDRHNTQAELRYATHFNSSINAVVGGFYQHTKDDLLVHIMDITDQGTPAGAFSPTAAGDYYTGHDGHTILGREDHRRTTQEAAYGELTWKPTSQLGAVVGLRYFVVDLDGYQVATHPFFTGTSQTPQYDASARYTNLSPKFNLSYKVDEAALVYLTVAEGFRSGGLNELGVPGDVLPRSFGPDSLWNYEVGLKGRLMDGLFDYQVDAFWIDWRKIQVKAQTAAGTDYIENLGKARVRGIEAQFDVVPVHGLTLSVAGSYQNDVLIEGATKEQYLVNPSLGLSGEALPNVPKALLNTTAEYDLPLAPGVQLRFAADMTYRSATNSYFVTYPGNIRLPGFAQYGLRASFDWQKWTAMLFGHNIFDKRGLIDGVNDPVTPYSVVAIRPRTVGLTLNRKF
jgi:iron complex outermembrane receptor protein